MGRYLTYAAGAAVLLVGPACSAQPATGGVEGRWTQESNGKELVLVPRIKLQPNVGITYGTSLGGTAGYGSPTRTTIVTEPVLMDVDRTMTLAIEADGRFEWTIVKRHTEKADCTVTTTQVKRGKLLQGSGALTFEIEGGTEDFTSSCGRQGNSELAKTSERYDIQRGSGRIVLRSGPVQWTFRRV